MTTPSDDSSTTKTIRALVVDDEELGRRNLCLALAEHAHWEVVAQAPSMAAAQEALRAQPDIEVVFLDIRMPYGSGLELAQVLAQQEQPPWIVFVTAFDEHAIEAFDLHALDYLLKPFSNRRLAKALAHVEQMVRLRQQVAFAGALRSYVEDAQRSPQAGKNYWKTLSVRSVGRIDAVSLDEVLRIEAQGNYAALHLPTRQLLFRASMTRLEQHLDPAVFLRVHRGTIVRREQALSLLSMPSGSYELRMRDGSRVAVSERYVTAVKVALQTG
ncbi:LytTR family DNA-binding domain-containing protein [Paucibacter sp. B2R-40]|uniref:LytR/AlgR family response regulator transcription factor n=1 Tax=Paucibacter sp. B2R-40 TaxID=2893554 RepID=UPI0021E41253|nr:LytTR family DNA-binding domain-containing protein [Paucibacter sp. B2R-40]MCV2353457.1 LytTR family DNA-binding domain-containing protein [Paucibacter sp. B2R-40]